MEKHHKKEEYKAEGGIISETWLKKWVRRHKIAARFIVRIIIAGLTSLVSFFRKKEKEIEKQTEDEIFEAPVEKNE